MLFDTIFVGKISNKMVLSRDLLQIYLEGVTILI